MNIVTDSTGKVIMFSSGLPEPPEGGTLYALTGQQEAAYTEASAQPNGGILFDGQVFTIMLPPPAVVSPATCTNVQLRLELASMGKLEQTQSLVAASGLEAQVAFEYTAEFTSDNPLLLALAPRIGIPAETVRDVILAASRRKVGGR